MKQGGVAIYGRKGIKTFCREDINFFKEGYFESCFAEVAFILANKKKNIILGEIYGVCRTTLNNVLYDCDELIDKIGKNKKN